MTSKEIVKKVIRRDNPPRIGLDFIQPYISDIERVPAVRFLPQDKPPEYFEFGRHAELLEQIPSFDGEVKLDDYGNIIGRLDSITKGECIRGVLDDWSKLKDFSLPAFDMSYYPELTAGVTCSAKYVVGGLPYGVFSLLRDARLIGNALMDTLLEQENVSAFLNIIAESMVKACAPLAAAGVDAIMIWDDWGTQDRTFIGLDSFYELFAPVYKKICAAAHSVGLAVILHSCGKNNLFVGPLVEAGIDVFQFDQPEVYPAEWLAENFADKAVFFMPVDIQKIMITGDCGLIKSTAKKMVDLFRARKASIIAMDYSNWEDIGVLEEWAAWAREAFIENAENK